MNVLFKRLKRWYRQYFKTSVEFSVDVNDQVIIVVRFDDTQVYRKLDGWDKKTCQLNEHGAFSFKNRNASLYSYPFEYTCAIFSSRSMHR